VACDLHHGAVRCQVAAQDLQAALLFERALRRRDHLLSGRFHRACDLVAQRVSARRERVAVHQAGFEHALRNELNAAGFVDVERDVLAAGAQVGDDRRALGDALEVLEGERHADRARHRNQVQHGVGRAAEDGDQHHRILERRARHDVARRIDCGMLAKWVTEHRLEDWEAADIAVDLAYNLAKKAYRL